MIELTVQRDDLHAHRLKRVLRKRTRRAVAACGNHLQLAGGPETPNKIGYITRSRTPCSRT